MVHDTHEFYSKIIKEIWLFRVLLLRLPLKRTFDEKSGTMLFTALKTGFVENKGQSGPLPVVSRTQGKCQFGYLSVVS